MRRGIGAVITGDAMPALKADPDTALIIAGQPLGIGLPTAAKGPAFAVLKMRMAGPDNAADDALTVAVKPAPPQMRAIGYRHEFIAIRADFKPGKPAEIRVLLAPDKGTDMLDLDRPGGGDRGQP